MINIREDGIVEYAGERDGMRWRTIILPGDTARAQELLSSEELAQVQAAWTPAVLDAWEQAQSEPEEPEDPGVPLPTVEERLAAVEDAVLELALGGLL